MLLGGPIKQPPPPQHSAPARTCHFNGLVVGSLWAEPEPSPAVASTIDGICRAEGWDVRCTPGLRSRGSGRHRLARERAPPRISASTSRSPSHKRPAMTHRRAPLSSCRRAGFLDLDSGGEAAIAPMGEQPQVARGFERGRHGRRRRAHRDQMAAGGVNPALGEEAARGRVGRSRAARGVGCATPRLLPCSGIGVSGEELVPAGPYFNALVEQRPERRGDCHRRRRCCWVTGA